MIRRAFRCIPKEFDEQAIIFARSASKARYRCHVAIRRAGFKSWLPNIRVLRAPEYDGCEPLRGLEPNAAWTEERVKHEIRNRAG